MLSGLQYHAGAFGSSERSHVPKLTVEVCARFLKKGSASVRLICAFGLKLMARACPILNSQRGGAVSFNWCFIRVGRPR